MAPTGAEAQLIGGGVAGGALAVGYAVFRLMERWYDRRNGNGTHFSEKDRKLLTEMAKNLQTLSVSTPDAFEKVVSRLEGMNEKLVEIKVREELRGGEQ